MLDTARNTYAGIAAVVVGGGVKRNPCGMEWGRICAHESGKPFSGGLYCGSWRGEISAM